MAQPILIYCPFTSNRLLYVLDWVFKTRLGIDYSLSNSLDAASTENCISYGNDKGVISVPESGLLNEQGLKQHSVITGSWNNTPTLYASLNASYNVPFDIFSAIFFLIARYEEYYSFTPDKHSRYPATDSILYKNNWLERPLVDEWIEQLRQLLHAKGIVTSSPSFSYTPTYDIDIAWSHKNKGITRTVGGIMRAVLSGRLNDVAQRIRSLFNENQDPYYSFEEIAALHKKYQYTPVYFVLAALHTGAFDKNISPSHPAMKQLIQRLAHEGVLGIHPSYNMNSTPYLLLEEKGLLEKISGIRITQSRQHYIRLWFPATYRQLIEAGITDDHSMGYGTHLGFRAGTANTFKWYDLENETATTLYVHPFCFMDSTARHELNLSADAAFAKLEGFAAMLKKLNTPLITVFHNFSLGTDAGWQGWPEAYAAFLKKMAK